MEKSELIFNNKNLLLIKNISSKKLNEYNIDANVLNDSFIIDISREVYKAEYKNFIIYEPKYFILKMNNIIIIEIVNYIIKHVQQEPMSTVIYSDSEDSEESEESEDSIGFLNPNQNTETTTATDGSNLFIKKEQKPSYSYELYSISSTDLVSNSFNLILDNVIEVKLHNFTIDNSDYIINEFNNCLEINNQVITVPIGNYRPLELLVILEQAINETNSGIVIKFNKINEVYSFEIIDQPDAVLNFNITNSIHKILGFEFTQTILTPGNNYCGVKHRLVKNPYINIELCFKYEENVVTNMKYKIPLDVPYNETKYFTPTFYNEKKTDVFRITSMNVKITNSEGNPYNTRSRKFDIDLIIKNINYSDILKT